MEIEQLILDLHQIGAVKFGSYTLKTGTISPIYLDLRVIISSPKILKEISSNLWEKISSLSFDLICGVPYTALPIASCLSLTQDIPMIMQRKEVKEYGTKKRLEGVFQKGQTCLIIEDVITTGTSIEETLKVLNEEGLKVNDVAVVVDRGQGGKARLEAKGLRVHCLLTLSTILSVLLQEKRIDSETFTKVKDFLVANTV
jgi:uridine monophosphate synthetase